jgi:hypothetical protein
VPNHQSYVRASLVSHGKEGEDEALDELPDVGHGRNSKNLPETSLQPVAYHALPRGVMDSLHYAMWGLSAIDLAPGVGELACDMVTNNVGYLGLCQTEFQRDFIMQNLTIEVLKAMRTQSKMYVPAFAKEVADFEKATTTKGTETKKEDTADEPVAKKPKVEAAAAPSGITSALAQMLAAAKVAKAE